MQQTLRRTTGVLAAAALLSATAVGTGVSAEAARCRAVRLPVPDKTTDSWVSTGSPSGKILAGEVYGAGTDKDWVPAIWRGGKVHLPEIPLESPTIAAVNSSGLAVGYGSERKGHNHEVSFTHQDGDFTKLPSVTKHGDSTVTAVNERGTVAVGSEMYSTPGGAIRHMPVRWSGPGLQDVERLPAPVNGVANGVRDNGSVVGYVGVPGGPGGLPPARAYVWRPGGDGEFLPDLRKKRDSSAEATRGRYAIGHDGPYVLWNLKERTVSRLPKRVYAAHDVNGSGEVAISTKGGRAAVVHDGDLRKLPSPGRGSAEAYTISDGGIAAGSFSDADSVVHAVVWRGCGS